MDNKEFYSPQTAGGLMVISVPTVKAKNRISEVMDILSSQDWGNVHIIYVLSDDKDLIGLVPISKILTAKENEFIEGLMIKPKLTIHPSLYQEKVVIEAIKADVESVPV